MALHVCKGHCTRQVKQWRNNNVWLVCKLYQTPTTQFLPSWGCRGEWLPPLGTIYIFNSIFFRIGHFPSGIFSSRMSFFGENGKTFLSFCRLYRWGWWVLFRVAISKETCHVRARVCRFATAQLYIAIILSINDLGGQIWLAIKIDDN